MGAFGHVRRAANECEPPVSEKMKKQRARTLAGEKCSANMPVPQANGLGELFDNMVGDPES